jgi:hypothetical protein
MAHYYAHPDSVVSALQSREEAQQTQREARRLVGSDAWSREARCVCEFAARHGLALDAEKLDLLDVRDLQFLYARLRRSPATAGSPRRRLRCAFGAFLLGARHALRAPGARLRESLTAVRATHQQERALLTR